MINQLRLYQIFADTEAEFLSRFQDHAARIMERHGFSILAMWRTTHREAPAFAYLLSWADEQAMRSAWASFMADEEWNAIKAQREPDAAPIVGEIVDLALEPVAFSKAIVSEPTR